LELLSILPALAEEILVPEAVVSELEAGRAMGVFKVKNPSVYGQLWLVDFQP
jgi:hypothetical protein